MELSLEKLSFGVPAAERDDDLIACFVTSETYNLIVAWNLQRKSESRDNQGA